MNTDFPAIPTRYWRRLDDGLRLGGLSPLRRLRLAGLYAFYAVTVPVDIVTVPFQIAGLLLMGRGVVK